MGEGQSKVQTRLLANTNPLIQRYLAPKPQVSPYRDGYYFLSRILIFLPRHAL